MTAQRMSDLLARYEADGKKQFPAHAWPGGYPIAYVTEEGNELCADCATIETGLWQQGESDDPPVAQLAYGSNADDPDYDVNCENCSNTICARPDDRDYNERLEDAERGGRPVHFTPKP